MAVVHPYGIALLSSPSYTVCNSSTSHYDILQFLIFCSRHCDGCVSFQFAPSWASHRQLCCWHQHGQSWSGRQVGKMPLKKPRNAVNMLWKSHSCNPNATSRHSWLRPIRPIRSIGSISVVSHVEVKLFDWTDSFDRLGLSSSVYLTHPSFLSKEGSHDRQTLRKQRVRHHLCKLN